MNIRIYRPPLPRSLRFIVASVLALANVAWGSGAVTNATQADLQAALNGGGTVTFGVGGVITLTNPIIIAQDTVLDANGFAVTISGGNAVRLFQVNSNVAFSVTGLTLANGSVVGANGVDASPPTPGQDGFGAGILNLGGTVALTDCTLQGHVAQGGNSGSDTNSNSNAFAPGGNGMGAALCNLGGALNLTNCLLASNSTLGGQSPLPQVSFYMGQPGVPIAGKALGAAIYSANGQVQCQAVTFTSCSVLGGPRDADPWGGPHQEEFGTAGGGSGGAIYATNSQVLLASSALTNNSATGGSDVGFGGALFLDQGCSGVIRLCLFSGNVANGAPGWIFTGAAGAAGGAVFNGGELQIWDSTFLTNSCAGGGFSTRPGSAGGGAIWSTNGLTINRSTFNSNQAAGGAGAFYAGFLAAQGAGGAVGSSGALAATNCTWSGNAAAGGDGGDSGWGAGPGGAGSGGGLCVSGGQAVLVNVTIAGNRANGGSGISQSEPFPPEPNGPSQGGGICNTNGTVLVLNSIVANSGATNGGDVWGVVTDGGYNICSDGTAGFSANSSLNQANPLLGPLADNGGPTLTMALLSGSPALDAIPSGFPPVDQCGTSRPQGPKADIGAFEALAGSAGGPLGITLLPGNSVAIQFLGVLGTTYNIEASTDLVHWTQLGAASAGTNGWFEFIDPAANLSAARFYRTRMP